MPSDYVQRDPFWIDFDTAVAMHGQLEQNKVEQEELDKSKTDTEGNAPTLPKKLKEATAIDDILNARAAVEKDLAEHAKLHNIPVQPVNKNAPISF